MPLAVRIKGALGIFGTGVWPFLVGRAHYSSHRGFSIEGSGADLTILGVGRDYISILYLPLFPLGLCAYCLFDWPDAMSRVHLDRENMGRLLHYVGAGTSMRRERRMANSLRANWVASAAIAVGASCLGWFVGHQGGSLLGGILGLAVAAGVANHALIRYLLLEEAFR